MNPHTAEEKQHAATVAARTACPASQAADGGVTEASLVSSGGAAAGGLERRWPKRVAGLGDVISGRDRDWCAKYHTGKFLQNFCALRAHRQISRKFLRAARAGIFCFKFGEILA